MHTKACESVTMDLDCNGRVNTVHPYAHTADWMMLGMRLHCGRELIPAIAASGRCCGRLRLFAQLGSGHGH